MGKCYNCETEFTLKSEEMRCDNCKKIVNFPCNACKEWFSIEGIKTCGFCGFYYCPVCNTCSKDCLRYTIYAKIRIIIPAITNEQLDKVEKYIEELKINREQKSCLNGVPITYAKERCKSCFIRLLGCSCKSDKDLEKFKERYESIGNAPLGTQLTINKSREDGSYGQEFRDVFNLAICMGKLKIIQIKKDINGEHIEYQVYERTESGTCKFFDGKDLVLKECPNKYCKIKIYPYKETHCICPECKYQKGEKKGQLRKLRVKISNKDTCQLNRGLFKKDGKDESARRSN